MSSPTYLDDDTANILAQTQFQNSTDADLWGMSFRLNSEAHINALSNLVAPPTPDQQPAPAAMPWGGGPMVGRSAGPSLAPPLAPLPVELSPHASSSSSDSTSVLGPEFRSWRPSPADQTLAPAGDTASDGSPVTMTSGQQQTGASLQPGESVGNVSMTDGGDLESYARSEAQRLGIDPDKAVAVGNTEGGFGDPTRQNTGGAPAYGPYQAYIGGPGNPGLGDEMLAQGIDPRKPEDARRAVTYSLEHAAQNGWGAFQGAAANGIGAWDGIGQAPTANPPHTLRQFAANSPPAAPTQSGQPQAVPSQSGEQFSPGTYTPNQIDAATSEGLDYETALAVCGPAAAIAFARKTGRNPTMSEALGLAKQVGWTAAAGMAEPASEQSLLGRMGVASRIVDGAPDWGAVASDVQRGNPVIVSTPGHYFVAEQYDPASGRFNFGNSAAILRASGGQTWFTPDQLAGLGMGSPRAALYMDSPTSPAPSVVAGQSAPTAGGASAPAGTVAPAADGSPVAGASDPLRQQLSAGNAGPASLKQMQPDQPSADLPYDPRADEQGPHEWRPQYGQADYATDDQGRAFNGAPSIGSWPGDDQNPTLPNYGGQPAPRPYVPDYTDPSQQPQMIPRTGGMEMVPPDAMYRQPLAATMGPDTTNGSSDQPMDPDQGPHEAGYTVPGGAQPTPGGAGLFAGTAHAGGPDPSPSPYPAADSGPHEATPGSVGAGPVGPLYGPPDVPPGVPSEDRKTSVPAPSGFPGLQAVYDSAGNFLHWIQGQAQGAADQIAQNQAGTRQAAEDANAGQSGGVDFGTGLANTAQTLGAGAPNAAVAAATAAYADPFWQAVPAPARAAYIVSQTAQAFGNEVGRNAAHALGIPDQEIVTILGHPITSHDIAGFVGGAVFDPTSYVAGGETDPILATARGAVRDIGGPLLRGAADTIDRGIAAGAEAINPRLAANAERVAAADARATEAGSTVTAGTFGPVPGGGSPSPQPQQTVEVLQQRLAQAQSIVGRLIDARDPERLAAAQDNRAAIESQLVDAQNARRALEPAIASDVGAREQSVPPPEQTVENRADAVNGGPTGPINPQDLSGPVSIPTDVGSRLNATAGVLPAGARGSGALGAVTREAGRVVAGGVGGATIGSGLPADTPEDRRRNTLIGAGIGMVAGPALSRAASRGAGGALASLGAIPERDSVQAAIRAAAARGDSAEVARLTAALPEGRNVALPGMEPPPARADVPERAISDAPNGPPVDRLAAAAGNVPPSEVRSPWLPGLEPEPAPPLSEHVQSMVGPVTGAPAPVPSVRGEAGQTYLPTMHDNRGVLQRVADAVAPWANRAQIVRYGSMLSDTATHVMNLTGNAILQGADVAATPIAAGIDVVRSAVTGAPREVFFNELGARIAGMRAGASVGLQMAVDVLRTGEQADTQIVNGRVVAASSVRSDATKLDQATQGFGTNIPGLAPAGSRAAGAIDFAFEGPLRALSAADAVFRTMAQGGHLAAEATAAAIKANGGKAVTPELIREAMKDPALLDRVNYLAAHSVLQEPRQLTAWYQRAIRSADPFTRAAATVEVPFVKTPYNVVAQGVGVSPLGLAGLIQDMAAGKAPREMEQRVARVALGTAVMAGAAADYAAGNLTGPRPSDPREASTLPPGWSPWSRKIPLPGGGTYYLPLAVLGPFALPPVMAILAGESAKKGKDALSPAWAGTVALGVGQYAAQQTMLQGLTNIGQLLDGRQDASKKIEQQVEQLASQFSPAILGGGALGKEIQRVMGMPIRNPQTAMEALLATHPLTAGQVQPQQDVLGRPVVKAPTGLVSALTRGTVENDASVIRAFRTAREGLPIAPPKQIRDDTTGLSRALTPGQQARWQRVFGAALREGWGSYGNPRDADTLRKVEGEARTAANETILGQR